MTKPEPHCKTVEPASAISTRDAPKLLADDIFDRVIAADAREKASLEIAGLDLWYGDFHALKSIDLAAARSEFVALLGPSGCGKTSLLRSIAGFAHPQRGTVRLNGRSVGDVPARQRNIGLVFQNYVLFPHMTARENVRFGLECRGVATAESDRRTEAALAMVGLERLGDRRPKQLSGGQQQRVALARALVIEPDILLLDEPLGALDKQLRVQMQTELKGLQRRLGVTVLFVTHDQEEAMSMADRIVIMREGKIEQIATPEDLFARPGTGWVCDFVGAGNLVRGRVAETANGTARFEAGAHCAFELDAAAAPGATDALFVRADRLRLEPVPGGEGMPVIARRFLGVHTEILADYGAGVLRALVPAEQAERFPIGTCVTASAHRQDCRFVPDDAHALNLTEGKERIG